MTDDQEPALHGAAPSEAVLGEVRRQQQIYLVKQLPIVMGVNLANGALVTLLFSVQGLTPLALGWFACLFLISAAQFAGWRQLRDRPMPKSVSGRSLRRAEHLSVILGTVWGAVCLAPTESQSYHMFLAVLIAGMTAGTASVLNPLPRIIIHFALPALTLLALRMLYEGSALHLIVAALSVVFGLALFRGSFRAYQQFEGLVAQSHALHEARADLVDALQSSQDAFALFDAAGKLTIANNHFRNWFPGAEALDERGGSMSHQQLGQRWVQSVVTPKARGGFVAVHTDITPLKAREEEIIERMREAEEANRAKSEFLANMSHELRTPLNAIIGFAEMLHGEIFGKLGSPKYREYSLDIFNSANHLLAIITDILDLSKIESQKYEVMPERVAPRDTLHWVSTLCQHQPRTAHRKPLEISIATEFGDLMADPRAFKQILLNLVNNAYKFTPETGRVGVDAFINEAGEPTITVWDTGIGIPADKLDDVRKPFHQVESAFQRKYQGTGLGLSISEALIKMHGGRIELQSELGVGTRVSVIFPAAAHMLNEPRKLRLVSA